MLKDLEEAIDKACQKLFKATEPAEINRTEEQFGDYATNIALKLAAKLGKNPREVAEQLADELKALEQLEKVEVAGPGFINLSLTNEALWHLAQSEPSEALAGQEILVEFGDPNPFKEMHIGHLYSYIVGDAICRLLESAGADIKRLSYHGDVGLQVAKAIFGLRDLQKERETRSMDLPAADEEAFLGLAYARGAQKYEEDEEAKAEIENINQHIYKQDNSEINRLYEEGRKLSFDYFDKVLSLLSINTDKRYLESQTAPYGIKMVEANTDKVFTKSQGAVVYEGEKDGLHTRVFITSKGLPTYETKDLGLVELKHQDSPKASKSIVITANEQAEYFKVMLAALSHIKPELAKKTQHLSHGFLSLTTGKMSSRSGNVYSAMKLLLEVKHAVHEQYPDSPAHKPTTFAAVKYALLKHRLGADIVVDVKESISLDGNSGPYLQYAHARACSILAKAGDLKSVGSTDLSPAERSLLRKISEYSEVSAKATAELMPHHICTYLYELAQNFNSFYETSRIIGDPRAEIRLKLVKLYSQKLKQGLSLLGIEAPQKM